MNVNVMTDPAASPAELSDDDDGMTYKRVQSESTLLHTCSV